MAMSRTGLKRRQARFNETVFRKRLSDEIKRYTKAFDRQLRLRQFPNTYEALKLEALKYYDLVRFKHHNQLIAYCRHNYTNYDQLLDTLHFPSEVSETIKDKCKVIVNQEIEKALIKLKNL